MDNIFWSLLFVIAPHQSLADFTRYQCREGLRLRCLCPEDGKVPFPQPATASLARRFSICVSLGVGETTAAVRRVESGWSNCLTHQQKSYRMETSTIQIRC